jgi:hypothetical protein
MERTTARAADPRPPGAAENGDPKAAPPGSSASASGGSVPGAEGAELVQRHAAAMPGDTEAQASAAWHRPAAGVAPPQPPAGSMPLAAPPVAPPDPAVGDIAPDTPEALQAALARVARDLPCSLLDGNVDAQGRVALSGLVRAGGEGAVHAALGRLVPLDWQGGEAMTAYCPGHAA